MELLTPSIQQYDWGTETFLADLLGLQNNGKPYAEAWYGAHPLAPSLIAENRPLTANLSYLLKILSINKPLSIQVHPTKQQAEDGFENENSLSIRLDDPQRTYKDANHKPETIVALEGGLEARAGLKNTEEVERIITLIGSKALSSLWQDIGMNLHNLVPSLLRLDDSARVVLVGEVLSKSALLEPDLPHEAYWLTKCAELYPQDIGVVVQMMLNYVSLKPGEGIHLPAGHLHAYLHGNGVEIMANSDNVVRAGLTPKHKDVGELLRIAILSTYKPTILQPGTKLFTQGLPDYDLHVIERASDTYNLPDSIVLSTSGITTVTQAGKSLTLKPGQAAFIQEASYEVKTTGNAFIASAGQAA